MIEKAHIAIVVTALFVAAALMTIPALVIESIAALDRRLRGP